MHGTFNRGLRWLFFAVVVRALVLVVLGLNVRHRERLPGGGPAIIVANHNSHLDTLVLMSLFPLRLLPRLRPVAAMDYFLRNRWLAWFAREIIGILPIARGRPKKGEDPLAPLVQALERGEILILYPEGTRGEPERMSTFRKGIVRLAERMPAVPVVPVYLHGLGKALPKGDFVLVPFFCDVFVGEPLLWREHEDRRKWMEALVGRMNALAAEGNFAPWE